MKRLVIVRDEEPVGISVLRRMIAKFDERRRQELFRRALAPARESKNPSENLR